MGHAHLGQLAALLDASIRPSLLVYGEPDARAALAPYLDQSLGPFSVKNQDWTLAGPQQSDSLRAKGRKEGHTALRDKPLLSPGWPGMLRERAPVVVVAVKLGLGLGQVDYAAVETPLVQALVQARTAMAGESKQFYKCAKVALVVVTDPSKFQMRSKIPWKRYRVPVTQGAPRQGEAMLMLNSSMAVSPIASQGESITSPIIPASLPTVPTTIISSPSRVRQVATTQNGPGGLMLASPIKNGVEVLSSDDNQSSRFSVALPQFLPKTADPSDVSQRGSQGRPMVSLTAPTTRPTSATFSPSGLCQNIDEALSLFTKIYLKTTALEGAQGVRPQEVVLVADLSGRDQSADVSAGQMSDQSPAFLEVRREMEAMTLQLGRKCCEETVKEYKRRLKKGGLNGQTEAVASNTNNSKEVMSDNKRSILTSRLIVHYSLKMMFVNTLLVALCPVPVSDQSESTMGFLDPNLHSLLRLAQVSSSSPYNSLMEKLKLRLGSSITASAPSSATHMSLQILERTLRELELCSEAAERPDPFQLSFVTPKDVKELAEAHELSADLPREVVGGLLGVTCAKGYLNEQQSPTGQTQKRGANEAVTETYQQQNIAPYNTAHTFTAGNTIAIGAYQISSLTLAMAQGPSVKQRCQKEISRTTSLLTSALASLERLIRTTLLGDGGQAGALGFHCPTQTSEALTLHIGLSLVALVLAEPLHRRIAVLADLRNPICQLMAEAGFGLIERLGEVDQTGAKALLQGLGKEQICQLALSDLGAFNNLMGRIKIKPSTKDLGVKLYVVTARAVSAIDEVLRDYVASGPFPSVLGSMFLLLRHVCDNSIGTIRRCKGSSTSSKGDIDSIAPFVSLASIGASCISALASLSHWSWRKVRETLRLVERRSGTSSNVPTVVISPPPQADEITDAFQALHCSILDNNGIYYTIDEITKAMGAIVMAPTLLSASAQMFSDIFSVMSSKFVEWRGSNAKETSKNRAAMYTHTSVLMRSPSLLDISARFASWKAGRLMVVPHSLFGSRANPSGHPTSTRNAATEEDVVDELDISHDHDHDGWPRCDRDPNISLMRILREAASETLSDSTALLQLTPRCERMVLGSLPALVTVDLTLDPFDIICNNVSGPSWLHAPLFRWVVLARALSAITGVELLRTRSHSLLRELMLFPEAALTCARPLITLLLRNWKLLGQIGVGEDGQLVLCKDLSTTENSDTLLLHRDHNHEDYRRMLLDWLRVLAFVLFCFSPPEFASLASACKEGGVALLGLADVAPDNESSKTPSVTVGLRGLNDVTRVNVTFGKHEVVWGDSVSVSLRLKGRKPVNKVSQCVSESEENVAMSVSVVANFVIRHVSGGDTTTREMSIKSAPRPFSAGNDNVTPIDFSLSETLTIDAIDNEASSNAQMILSTVNVLVSFDGQDTVLMYILNPSPEGAKGSPSLNICSVVSRLEYKVQPLLVASTNVIPSVYGISIHNICKASAPPTPLDIVLRMAKIQDGVQSQNFTSTLEGYVFLDPSGQNSNEAMLEVSFSDIPLVPVPLALSKSGECVASITIPCLPSGERYSVCLVVRNSLSNIPHAIFELTIRGEEEVVVGRTKSDNEDVSVSLVPTIANLQTEGVESGFGMFREETTPKRAANTTFKLSLFRGRLQQSEIIHNIITGFNPQHILSPNSMNNNPSLLMEIQVLEAVTSYIQLKNAPMPQVQTATPETNRRDPSRDQGLIIINGSQVPFEEPYSILNRGTKNNCLPHSVGPSCVSLQPMSLCVEMPPASPSGSLLSKLFNVFTFNNSVKANNKVEVSVSDGQDIDTLISSVDSSEPLWRRCLEMCKTSFGLSILTRRVSKQFNGIREPIQPRREDSLRLWARIPSVGFLGKPITLSVRMMGMGMKSFNFTISIDTSQESLENWFITGFNQVSIVVTHRKQRCDFTIIPRHTGILKLPNIVINSKLLGGNNEHRREISCREIQIVELKAE